MNIHALQQKGSQLSFSELQALKTLSRESYERLILKASDPEDVSGLQLEQESFTNILNSIIDNKTFDFIGE